MAHQDSPPATLAHLGVTVLLPTDKSVMPPGLISIRGAPVHVLVVFVALMLVLSMPVFVVSIVPVTPVMLAGVPPSLVVPILWVHGAIITVTREVGHAMNVWRVLPSMVPVIIMVVRVRLGGGHGFHHDWLVIVFIWFIAVLAVLPATHKLVLLCCGSAMMAHTINAKHTESKGRE